MTRDDIREKFRDVDAIVQQVQRATDSPVYLEFLQGERELPCTAWGNPTRNVKGWKGPCYLITDVHHTTFDDLMTRRRGRTTATATTRAASTAWCTAATSRRPRSASTRS